MKHASKQILITLVAAILVVILAAPACQAAKRRYLSIAGGSERGVIFSVAGALARAVRKPLRAGGIRISAEATDNQVISLKMLAKGEYELAIVQNVVAAQARSGKGDFKGKPIEDLTVLCALLPLKVQLMARKEAGIQSISDLKGKKVLVGPKGSGVELNAEQVLSGWGLGLKDLAASGNERLARAVDLLTRGRFDAGFFTEVEGEATLANLAVRTPMNLIPVKGPGLQKILAQYPGYQAGAIPGGIYKGNNASTPTVSVMALLVAKDSLDAKIVHQLLEAIFANLRSLGRYQTSMGRLSVDNAVVGLSIPLHPAAAEFFKAKGVSP